MFHPIALSVVLAAALLVPPQSTPLRGATAASADAARQDPQGIWLLYSGGKPTGVFIELRARGASFEARVAAAPLISALKPGDRVPLPADLRVSDVSRGHEGLWAQAIEGTDFFAERGCCDDRYWISASWDLNGDWTAVEGARGSIAIVGVRNAFGAFPATGFEGPGRFNFAETSPGRFEGTFTQPGTGRKTLRLRLRRTDDRSSRAACGADPQLELRVDYEGGRIVLRRCAA